MGAAITLAGADLIAQKQVAQEGLDVVRFIFANVPGLNHAAAVDRAAGLPPAEQVVHTAIIPAENKGYVNPNQVVYSVQVGSDVGDWDFNWIGLETAEGVLFAVSYVPLQQKRRNIPPLQIGNNITRNFLVVFDGAQALTGITIDASTWQHDFTVRLAGIDERERQSNRDIFGRACFFGSALQLEKVGDTYQLKPGTAYIEGVRLQRAAALPVVPPAFPTTAWLDVALQRELNDVVASWSVVWGAGKVDYVDSAGVQHYCVAIADLPNSNTITDSRPVENIAGPLVMHFAARVGDYAGLRARATTKSDVGLGNLPNAKSDDPDEDDSEILATTKALRAAILRLAQPFDALPFPTIGTPTNRLNVTAATDAGAGGRISVPAGVPITLAQEVEAGKTARPAGFTTAAWTSATLDTNSTYFLRAHVSTDGALVFYMQKGTDTDTSPASLKGTAGGVAGGGFDSTVLDMLVAKVVTGIAGSMPSVISLANAQRLFTEFSSSGPAYTPGFNLYVYQQSFTINWARRPTAVPVFAAVSQIGISSYVEGGANYARSLAVTRYSIDCKISTDWHTMPTSPYGAIDGTAAA